MFGLDEKFLYLPWLVIMSTVIVSVYCYLMKKYHVAAVLASTEETDGAVLINSVVYHQVHQDTGDTKDEIIPTTSVLAAREQAKVDALKIMPPVNFSDTYSSYGVWTQRLLCLYRISGMLYFAIVAIALNEERHHTWGWYYFTSWNLWLLSVYFSLASAASLVGCLYDKPGGHHCDRLAVAVHAFYEVAGSTALLVSIVAFCFLDPPPKTWRYWNMVMHVNNTIAVIGEFILNSIEAKWIHCLLQLSWVVSFTVFIWIVVVAGWVPDWPYPFLQTAEWTCFLWYLALLFMSQTLYFGFQKLSAWKMGKHRAYLRECDRILEETENDNFFGTDAGQSTPYIVLSGNAMQA